MNVQELAENIKIQFLQIEGSTIRNETDSLLPENPTFPGELQELLQFGNVWLNTKIPLYLCVPKNWAYTVDFVGDISPEEWREEHPGPNCCDKNYRFFGKVGEFDGFFVDINPKSQNYGAVRYAVENESEDTLFTPAPFANFLQFLELWTKHLIQTPDFDNEEVWESFFSISSTIRGEDDEDN